ncbi:MAG: hypothetical protein K1060chlam2_00012 [Chlamydiae bacterium]|nr:hypothetical protein [Chlamydiota bacterium]
MSIKLIRENLQVFYPKNFAQAVGILDIELNISAVADYFSLGKSHLEQMRVYENLIVPGALFQKALQSYKNEFSPYLIRDLSLGIEFCDKIFPTHKKAFLMSLDRKKINTEELKTTIGDIDAVFRRMREEFEKRRIQMVEFRDAIHEFSKGIAGFGVAVNGYHEQISLKLEQIKANWDMQLNQRRKYNHDLSRGKSKYQSLIQEKTEASQKKNKDRAILSVKQERLSKMEVVVRRQHSSVDSMQSKVFKIKAKKENTIKDGEKELQAGESGAAFISDLIAIGQNIGVKINKGRLSRAKKKEDKLLMEQAHLPLTIEELKATIENDTSLIKEGDKKLKALKEKNIRTIAKTAQADKAIQQYQMEYDYLTKTKKTIKLMVPNETFIYAIQALDEFISILFSNMFAKIDGNIISMTKFLSLEKKFVDRTNSSILRRGFDALGGSVGKFREFCFTNGGLVKSSLQLKSSKSTASREERALSNHLSTIETLNTIATNAFNTGKYSEALTYRETLLTLLKQIHKEDHVELVNELILLAEINMKLGNQKKTVEYGIKTLAMSTELFPDDNNFSMKALELIGAAYQELGQKELEDYYTDQWKQMLNRLELVKKVHPMAENKNIGM